MNKDPHKKSSPQIRESIFIQVLKVVELFVTKFMFINKQVNIVFVNIFFRLLQFQFKTKIASLIKLLQTLKQENKTFDILSSKIMILNQLLHSTHLVKKIQSKTFQLSKLCSKTLRCNFFSSSQKEKQNPQNKRWWIPYAVGIPFILGVGLYQYTKYHFLKYTIPQEQQPEPQIYDEVKVSSKIVRLVKYIIRFVHLTLIFLPSILCMPLALFPSTLDYWMSIFLWSIQNAGVVWIKAFQYLSHRRDVIGPQMAQKFSKLRQNSPSHSQQQTKGIFKRVYGVNIDQMFDEFDYKAIASGSISQVYKAKLQGKKIALKVRHPNVQKNIERDIDILFFFSRVFSKISKQFQIPVNDVSLKKILIDQVYLTRQSKNLKKFNRIMKNPDVKFPIPYPQTNDEVLVQSFVEGLPITFYIEHPHKLNKAIAKLGASTFFEMLMKHNFVHADCHGGNIYVRIQPNIKYYRPFQDMFKNLQNWIIAHVIKISFDSPLLKKLAQDNYQYEKNVNQLLQKSKSTVQITLLDVGMVINLNQKKKKAFRDFLREIVKGNAKQCAQMIYNISKYESKQIKDGKSNAKYLQDLQEMFSMVNKTELEDLQGIDVLNGMLRVIRKHNMKIDGQISILFTNMLVLEAIAKQLDPKLNILRCAIPFLVHQSIEQIKDLDIAATTQQGKLVIDSEKRKQSK